MNLHYYRTEKGGELRQEMVLTRAEQEIWYKECLNRIIANPREVLDQLDYCAEYKVNWNNYSRKKHKCVKCGKEYSTTRKQRCTCGNTTYKVVHYGIGHLRQNLPQRAFQNYNKDNE